MNRINKLMNLLPLSVVAVATTVNILLLSSATTANIDAGTRIGWVGILLIAIGLVALQVRCPERFHA